MQLFQRLKAYFNRPAKFGTISGVIVPDVLTILGVILYLRLGWVVGNSGFFGAIVIILLAKSVTLATGLSMSSITTNIKIGAGGAYSIIAKSLGLEAGGSVGIPFYISQSLSVSLYIIGFAEGWLAFFPDHSYTVIIVVTWLLVSLISYISANFAIKIQYIILFIIALSLVSFFSAKGPIIKQPVFIGSFEDGGFWKIFAIFFPAVTGIMAGANLSGDLKNPRKAIPVGTLTSVFLTMAIYIFVAWFMSRHFTSDQLRSDPLIMVDAAFWGPVVVMGILAATFSSALGSMIGAPRILQALASHKTVPFKDFFSQKTANNEPRNAMIFTGILVFIAILSGSLNALATLITMFFLITYGMLNLVVFMQQAMKIISFRPTFRIPRFVPLYGAISCFLMMILINPLFSIVAIIVIISLYIWLTRRGLESEWGDIRGGFFLSLAEKASNIAATFPRHKVSWKPDFLIPVENPEAWHDSLLFLRDIVIPSGSIYAFSVKQKPDQQAETALSDALLPMSEDKVLVNSTVIEDGSFIHGAKIVIQTLRGGSFRPNTLVLNIGKRSEKDSHVDELAQFAMSKNMGLILIKHGGGINHTRKKKINIWLRDKSPNWNLALLTAIQMQANLNGQMNLISATTDGSMIGILKNFLNNLVDHARLPSKTELFVLEGQFPEVLKKAPDAEVNMFGLAERLDFGFMRLTQEITGSSCLFVKDSGEESVLA